MKITKFLEGVNDWNNHLPLLWLALEETKTGDVLELGCGDGSTRQLHEYCANRRFLYSFDTDLEWLNRFKQYESGDHKFIHIVNDWHKAKDTCPNPSVVLIDHAPGERRIVDVKRFADINGILVLHDTQPPPTAADYGWERIWSLFKYRVDLSVPMNHEAGDNRTWASAVSNTYDVTKWKGQIFKEEYKLI